MNREEIKSIRMPKYCIDYLNLAIYRAVLNVTSVKIDRSERHKKRSFVYFTYKIKEKL